MAAAARPRGSPLARVCRGGFSVTSHSIFLGRRRGGTRNPGASVGPVPKGYRRFRGQTQRPSSWGRSPALFGGSDGRAQTRGVSESAAVAAGRLWKTCYNSCDTDSVQESKVLNFGPQRGKKTIDLKMLLSQLTAQQDLLHKLGRSLQQLFKRLIQPLL